MKFTSALLVLALASCETNDENKGVTAPNERSQVIVAQPGTPTAAPTPAAVAPTVSARPSAPRRLCQGQMSPTGKSVPRGGISRAQGSGTAELPDALRLGRGWTWVNFWAAWCVPCKEEIPRLLGWQKKLEAEGKSFRVVFVSLDDDPRQLQNFLDSQPADGLKATYWLREGKEREDWLKSVGISGDPSLPAHLLVDRKAEVRCNLNGAIEDTDYPSLASLIGG